MQSVAISLILSFLLSGPASVVNIELSPTNVNGFYTECSMSYGDAELEHEFLDILNDYLRSLDLPPAIWAPFAELHEYCLIRSMEASVNYTHDRPEPNKTNYVGEVLVHAPTVRKALDLWIGSPGHNMILTEYCPGSYISVAYCDGLWCLICLDPVLVPTFVSYAPTNYYKE